jgi:hypothetical protein
VAACKAAGDDTRRKRRADHTHLFSGPLNKSRRKEELEDIAIALALPKGGKKDNLFQRISDHFKQHPDLKTSPRLKAFSTHGHQSDFVLLISLQQVHQQASL